MKYTTTVLIARPRAHVLALFDNPENYSAWQETLLKMERLEGTSGEVGAKTRLTHVMGKREITMVETVTRRELPERFVATYEAPGVWNEADNQFDAVEDGTTRWELHTEFRCRGMMWLMTTLAPWMFKKQTLATMQAFKRYAEETDPG